jgi:signal transduction histidine kinase
MNNTLFDRQKILDTVLRMAQYMAGLTVQPDIWSEIGNVISTFFKLDLFAIGERGEDGSVMIHHSIFSDESSCEKILTEKVKEFTGEVLESGFLATEVIPTPYPCSLVFLPVIQENRTSVVLLVGHKTSKALPKDLLNVYLAVARLVSTTITKLAAESSLRNEIVERKKAEEALQKAHDELEDKVAERTKELTQANIRLQEMDRLKSVFLTSMSHELRTPMNSIIGFTGIILQGMAGDVNEEQRKQLTMVKNSGSHLLGLIDDVLDISNIEAGRVELSLEEFGLNDVVSEVVKTLSPAASEKSLELLTEVPEGITLFTDRKRIKQMLMNLVSNAVKFTNQGSVKIAARVPGDDNLEIRVIDTGVGIKNEDIKAIPKELESVYTSLRS